MSVFYLPDDPDQIAAAKEDEARYAALYGSAIFDSFKSAAPKPTFPRSDADKVDRMDKFIEWKRGKVRERVRIHLLVAGALVFGSPVVIALGSYLWRWAVDALIG